MHKMCCLKKANQLKIKKKIKKNRASQPTNGGGNSTVVRVGALRAQNC